MSLSGQYLCFVYFIVYWDRRGVMVCEFELSVFVFCLLG